MRSLDANLESNSVMGPDLAQHLRLSLDGLDGAEIPSQGKCEDAEPVPELAKIMRLAMMVKHLLYEVRNSTLDDTSRNRLREICDQVREELTRTMSPDLTEELERVAPPFDSDLPSQSELRVAQAQLVGWLEGLFHGIRTTVFAQEMATQSQLEPMQRQGPPAPAQAVPPEEQAPRTYL
jgi:Protein of unknown function (DUF2587)